MERRNFLLRVLLGWLAVITAKTPIGKTSERSQNMPSIMQNPNAIVFYVAPNGDDSWSGKLQDINSNRDDGPFATVERAKMAVRELKQQQGRLSSPVKVVLRGGTYFLSKTLIFKPQDSGSKEFPITYQSHPGETAIISGGRKITGWQEETVNNRQMWSVTLPAEFKKKPFQHFWVNGERRNCARYPNAKKLKVKAVTKAEGQPWHKGQYNLQYHDGDLLDGVNFVGGELVVMSRWVESRLPITRIDKEKKVIHFSKETVFTLQPGDLYYIENTLDILDTPGDWYLDRDRAKLYYLPKPGEAIDTIEAIAPILHRTMLLDGKSDKTNFIRYLNFYNLSFQHTNWELPENRSGYNYLANGVIGAIAANGIRRCVWQNCTWSHLGNYALEFKTGCQYNRISNCQMYDLGAGGIKIGFKPKDDKLLSPELENHHTQIVNNDIYDGGKFFHSAAGIYAIYSHSNKVEKNHVRDFYYNGICFRGTWGFKKTSAYKNIIRDNYVHHIGKLSSGEGPFLSDMGGIYTLGLQPGTVISGNIVRDVYALRYGGRGIYLDEGSSHIIVENNLVYRTSHSSLALHFGKENTIRNNVFALSGESLIYRAPKDYNLARKQKYISLRLEHNIFFWEEGKLINPVAKNPGFNIEFDRNIYWHKNAENINIANLSWQQWQQQGEDSNSLVANPLFVAPQQGDFRLQPNSPAIKLGFNPDPIPLHGKLSNS